MNFSRRGFIKGAVGAAGAAAGARIAGPFAPPARAAGVPSHFVHIYFNGGFNAMFAGNADKCGGAFGLGSAGMTTIGNGVVTDSATFGTVSDFAKAHWGAFGVKHGQALHTTPQNLRSGGERALLINGDHSYLNELAFLMGGDSAFKAVYFGDRAPAYQNQPAFKGVPLQRVSDLKDALKAAGGGTPDPDAPNRAAAAAALEAAQESSQRQIGTNPGRLSTLTDAYNTSVDALKKPLPPPVSFAELDTAYNLGGTSNVTSRYGAMVAGAELMIRAAGSNVINICDYGLASWDFHQLSGGKSQNGTFSRTKFNGSKPELGRLAPIKTFLKRMLELPDRNVVVAISGELVRRANGDHGDGTVVAMFGKNIKQGVSFGAVDSNSNLTGTPNVAAFWAAVAAALKVDGTPFGENKHAKLIA